MNKNLQVAIQAAIEAGEAIMEIYKLDFEVALKADNSPLTAADQKANKVIMHYLAQTDYPIISEENKQIDYQERKTWTSCWIVDPLDGTKEFIKKNGEFTVNIALVHHQKTSLGVIYVPATKLLYYADVETGLAQKVQLEQPVYDLSWIEQKATPIQPKEDANQLRIVGSRSHMSEDTTQFINSLQTEKNIEVVSKGSSLKFCLVADGEADIYPRFAPTMEWDTAAGQAICKAVGLQVIDQKTGEEMLYNRENLLNNYFMVSNQN